MQKKPVAGVRFEPSGDANPLEWTMHVDAPREYVVNGATRPCPYAAACFPVRMVFPANYPFKHPEMTFTPGQLYHPNVDAASGQLCAEAISKFFGPTKNVADLAAHVQDFLRTPTFDSPLNGDAAQELMEPAKGVAAYEDKARRAAAGAPRKAAA